MQVEPRSSNVIRITTEGGDCYEVMDSRSLGLRITPVELRDAIEVGSDSVIAGGVKRTTFGLCKQVILLTKKGRS